MDIQVEAILYGGQFKKLLEARSAQVRNKYDIKKAELEILYFLSRCGNSNTASDIYHQLMMNRGHISQAVENLCKRKFIVAIPDENDRRYVHYEIQEPAKDILKELTAGREEMYKLITSDISEDEMKTFREVASKIKLNIEKML